MTVRLAGLARTLAIACALACAACEDSAPPAGEACRASGGTCSTAACGASLPYPCPSGQSCCEPPPSAPTGDAGAD